MATQPHDAQSKLLAMFPNVDPAVVVAALRETGAIEPAAAALIDIAKRQPVSVSQAHTVGVPLPTAAGASSAATPSTNPFVTPSHGNPFIDTLIDTPIDTPGQYHPEDERIARELSRAESANAPANGSARWSNAPQAQPSASCDKCGLLNVSFGTEQELRLLSK